MNVRHHTGHVLQVRTVEELTDYIGAESFLGAAGIKVVVEETEVLKE